MSHSVGEAASPVYATGAKAMTVEGTQADAEPEIALDRAITTRAS